MRRAIKENKKNKYEKGNAMSCKSVNQIPTLLCAVGFAAGTSMPSLFLNPLCDASGATIAYTESDVPKTHRHPRPQPQTQGSHLQV